MKNTVKNHECTECGRVYDDIENGTCPSDDCPSRYCYDPIEFHDAQNSEQSLKTLKREEE